jgi:uncharacterized protein YjbI with pentapeptide repeats
MEEGSEEKKQESILSRIQSHLYNCFLKTQWRRILWSICFAVLAIIGFYYLEKALLPLIPEKKPKYNYLLELVDLDSLRTLSLLSGIFLYILESDERRKHRQYRAWQDIDHAKSKTSPLRRKRLEELYRDGVSLEDIELQGTDLRKITLSGAKLIGANFCKADLSSSYLQESNLSYANLSEAKLWLANLSNTDLELANLNGADLKGANLSGANLNAAKLNGADLTSANLTGANLEYAKVVDADLTGANLSGANLEHIRWSEQNDLWEEGIKAKLLGVKGFETAKGVSQKLKQLWKEQNFIDENENSANK